MIDLSQTTVAKSDQLNSDDLIGGDITVKITKVSLAASPDQHVALNYEGDNGKPYLPCKSMRRVLINIWGSDGTKYVGRSLTLYRDAKVKFGGLEVGGIRISHMSHITSAVTMALTATRSNKKPFTVKPLVLSESVKAESVSAVKEDIPIDPVTETLLANGLSAANKGLQPYKDWLAGLTKEQKDIIKPSHSEWSKIAKSVV